jgi:hypothetical protein
VPDLTVDQLTIALAVVAGVALVSLLFVLTFAVRLRRLRRRYAIFRGEHSERDVVDVVSRLARRIDGIGNRVDGLIDELASQAASGRLAIQRFHIVRYDAFEDMGGRMSFSAALLDENGDGVIITSINGRTETRTYAKPIKGLASEYNLSEEEREAIAGAMAGYERVERRPAATRSG